MLVDSLVRFALLGSSWVLYLLLGLSVVSFTAMFERWVFFRKNQRGGEGLREALKRAVVADDEQGIAQALSKSTTVEAGVLREAFEFRDGGAAAFGDGLESALGKARGDLERSMTLLGTLGNNAPFVGLFGTVLGVIEAFAHLGTGDDAAMTGVMSGIAEALVATGVGIFVAIPAVVAFNVAQKKIGDVENDTTALGKLISAWLHTRAEHARVRTPDGASEKEHSATQAKASPSESVKGERKKLGARTALPADELASEGAE